MSDKLFNVQIVTEVIVKADSKEAAEKVAKDNERDIVMNDEFDFNASSAMVEFKGKKQVCLPYGWEMDSVPYGSEGDETIRMIIDADKEMADENAG